jgi:hypothetical protein
MKKCPKCGQTYEDKDLNFCYNDGELLGHMAEDAPTRVYSESPSYVDDAPPTEFLGSARITNQTNWNPPQAPPAVWQGNQPNVPFSQYPTQISPNQTLAVVSLGLGVGSITLGWCCWIGVLLSPAALVTGIIALLQIKKDPLRNGGRGFAIAGIATGALFVVVGLLYFLLILLGAAVG